MGMEKKNLLSPLENHTLIDWDKLKIHIPWENIKIHITSLRPKSQDSANLNLEVQNSPNFKKIKKFELNSPNLKNKFH